MERLNSGKPFNRNHIRTLFRQWGSTPHLGKLPLAGLPFVSAYAKEKGYRATENGRGLALREIILEEIEGCRPGQGEPDFSQKRWRPYVILREQFISGRSPEWVAAQLHIARRTYFKEQRGALDLLAEALSIRSQQYDAAAARKSVLSPAPFLAPPPIQRPFVGRGDLIHQLKTMLLPPQAPPVALMGLPGVGKSSLLQELAADPEIRQRFPDGVLWAGLGQTPDPFTILGRWAQALGILSERLTAASTLSKRINLVHEFLGGRAVLICIDDCWNASDGLALRVGGPACGHLLTTRFKPIAFDFAGSRQFVVPEFSETESEQYFSDNFSEADLKEDRVAEFSRLAGGLPLALHLISRLIHQRGWGETAREIEAAAGRLALERPLDPVSQSDDGLRWGSLTLQKTIALSVDVLPDRARATLAALSLFPSKPNSFGREMAEKLVDDPGAPFVTLQAAGLVEELRPDRFSLHQTIRDYAAELPLPNALFTRYMKAYAAWAHATAKLTNPTAEVNQEWDNFLKGLQLAVEHQQPQKFIDQLTPMTPVLNQLGGFETVIPFLQKIGRVDSLLPQNRYLLNFLLAEAMYAVADYSAAHDLLENLRRDVYRAGPAQRIQVDLLFGQTLFYLGKTAAAEKIYRQLLREFPPENHAEAWSKGALNLSLVLSQQGSFSEAEAFVQQGLNLAEKLDLEFITLSASRHLAHIKWRQRDLAGARALLERIIPIYQSQGKKREEMLALHNWVGTLGGDEVITDSIPVLERILKLSRSIDFRETEVFALSNLGIGLAGLGRFEAAYEYLHQGIALAREINLARGEASCLIMFGRTHFRQGRLEEADSFVRQGLKKAEAIDEQYYVIECHLLLGHIAREQGLGSLALEYYATAENLRQAQFEMHTSRELIFGRALVLEQLGQIREIQTDVQLALRELEKTENPLGSEAVRTWVMAITLLNRLNDPRGTEFAIKIGRQLHALARKLSAYEREQFLYGMRFNREILELASPVVEK